MTRIVKKPAVRRREIIRAARHLFLTKEYDNATMQNIVDHLGIAKGTIYHYFKYKEELLEAVVEEDHRRKCQLLRRVKGDAVTKIRALVERDSLAVKNEALLDKLHQPGNIGLHARLMAVSVIKETILYSALIQQGCKEGVFQTRYPKECAEFILSAILFLTDIGVYPWKDDDLKRRAHAFPSFIEALLMAPKDSFNFMISIPNVIEKLGI